MPPKVQVETLRSSCLKSVRNNLAYWSVEDRPYDILPAALLEEVIREVTCFYCDTRHGDSFTVTTYCIKRFLRQVAGPKVRRLTWGDRKRRMRGAFVDIGPDGPVMKCINLTELNLTGHRGKMSDLAHALSSLRQLQSLYLSHTDADGAALEAVAACCRELKELRLDGCCNVTDAAMTQLVRQTSSEVWSCAQLRLLDVRSTKVRCPGLYHVLTHIPTLTALKSIQLLSAINKFAQLDNTKRSLNLSFVEIDESPSSHYIQFISTSLWYCPNITDIRINARWFIDEKSLKCTIPFKKLSSLKLFDCGVKFPLLYMLLSGVGGTVRELTLEEAANIVLYDLHKACPHLQSLSCVNCSFRPTADRDSNTKPAFTELRHLSVQCDGHLSVQCGCSHIVNKACLDILTHFPYLRTLAVTLAQFDDIIMERMCGNNQFEHLERARIYEHALSTQGVSSFLEHCPCIQQLNITCSSLFPNSGLQYIKGMCRENTWDLVIEEYSYYD